MLLLLLLLLFPLPLLLLFAFAFAFALPLPLLLFVSRRHPEPEAALFAADAKDPRIGTCCCLFLPLPFCLSFPKGICFCTCCCLFFLKLTSSTLTTGRNPLLPFLLSSPQGSLLLLLSLLVASEIGPGFSPDI